MGRHRDWKEIQFWADQLPHLLHDYRSRQTSPSGGKPVDPDMEAEVGRWFLKQFGAFQANEITAVPRPGGPQWDIAVVVDGGYTERKAADAQAIHRSATLARAMGAPPMP